MIRQHQSHHHQSKPKSLEVKFKPCKSISSEGTRDQVANHRKHSNDDGVFVENGEINSERFPATWIVVKSELAGPKTEIIENDIFRFERTAQHPQKRIKHD